MPLFPFLMLDVIIIQLQSKLKLMGHLDGRGDVEFECLFSVMGVIYIMWVSLHLFAQFGMLPTHVTHNNTNDVN